MRYSGKLGISQQTEVSPGIWEEAVTEHDVLGTMKQRSEALAGGDDILTRVSTTTSVSLLARGIGPMDNSMLRYLTHAGKRWTISTIVDKPPTIVLYFGEEYRGPIPEPTP